VARRDADAAPRTVTHDDPTPVSVARRNFWFTSIEDPSGFRDLDLVGTNKVEPVCTISFVSVGKPWDR
jgi:hypothetical protein